MIINSFIFSSAPSYPASLKLFIDAGNPLSYSGSGTTVTDLIGTQNGTLINGTSYSSADGGSFVFDGINDYITFGINTAIQPTTARTVSVWVYIDPTKLDGMVFCDGNFNTDRSGSSMWHYSDNYFKTEISSNSANITNYITDASVGTATGVWHHWTYSFDGASFKVYIDGILKNTVIQTLTVTNGIHPTRLGEGNVYSLPLKGKISQCKIYNVQRSDAEVLTDFNEFKARYGY